MIVIVQMWRQPQSVPYFRHDESMVADRRTIRTAVDGELTSDARQIPTTVVHSLVNTIDNQWLLVVLDRSWKAPHDGTNRLNSSKMFQWHVTSLKCLNQSVWQGYVRFWLIWRHLIQLWAVTVGIWCSQRAVEHRSMSAFTVSVLTGLTASTERRNRSTQACWS